MKKFLSLVLALVMTMSLVTISAGATDFTDDSKIQYEAAVKVMDMLGVVGGYSDGTFRPTANLTRGAAAKIITNIKLTPAVADALKGSETPFKDVPSTNVFSGAIAYCASEGIISGYADGTFRPAGTLTGNAFMKMLIGVLGYDTTDYTGKNFATKVALKAKELKLTEGTTFVGAKAATREEACLYAFNALYLDTVYYEGGSSVTINGAVIAVGAVEKKGAPLANAFGLEKPVDDTDAFGRPATKYVAGKKSVTIADAAELTYTGAVTAKKLADDLGLAKKDTLKVNNVVLAKDSTVLTGTGVNTVTYIYANADGSYKAVIVDYQKTTVSKVNPANVKNETARNIELTAVKKATYDTEKFAVNDVVLYVYNNTNGIVDVVAPETIEGSVSSMSKTGATVVINGKTYANAASLTLNSKGTFYLSLDGTTIIDAAAVAEVTSDQYAYIYQIVKTTGSTGYDDNGMPVTTKDSYKAYFVKADGTLGNAPIAGEALKGKVIPYTLNAQGVMVQAKPATGVSASSDFASAKIGKNTKIVNNYYMGDDTDFVFVDTASGKLVYSKVTGYKNVEEMTAPVFVVGNATTKKALTVFVNGTVKAAETAANYAFLQTIDPATSLDADGVTVLYTYKVLLQGEKEPTTLVAKSDILANYGLGARFQYTTAGGYLSTVKDASATVRAVKVTFIGEGYVVVTPNAGDATPYDLAAGFVAYLNDGTALSVDELKVGDTVNCYLDGNGKISVAVIYPRAD